MIRRIFTLVAVATSILHSGVCFSDVGVSEPEWSRPPTVYKIHHRLTVPAAEDVDDIVELGNFTSQGATVDIVFVGNGERMYGASGDVIKVREGLYVLPDEGDDSCTLMIHAEGSRTGIEGLPSVGHNSRFCPSKPIWLPMSRH